MKTIEYKMFSEFGGFCARGDAAVAFLNSTVYPEITLGSKVVFDFDGVRNLNSSFSNALFANLTAKYGTGVLDNVGVVNAKENVRKEIVSSFALATKRITDANTTNK